MKSGVIIFLFRITADGGVLGGARSDSDELFTRHSVVFSCPTVDVISHPLISFFESKFFAKPLDPLAGIATLGAVVAPNRKTLKLRGRELTFKVTDK